MTMAESATTIAPLTLTKEQAAAALNVPVDTLLNLTRTGQLRSVQIGKHKRWLMADLKAYVENQRNDEPCARKAGDRMVGAKNMGASSDAPRNRIVRRKYRVPVRARQLPIAVSVLAPDCAQ